MVNEIHLMVEAKRHEFIKIQMRAYRDGELQGISVHVVQDSPKLMRGKNVQGHYLLIRPLGQQRK